jgi:chromate transport protein ChrA
MKSALRDVLFFIGSLVLGTVGVAIVTYSFGNRGLVQSLEFGLGVCLVVVVISIFLRLFERLRTNKNKKL